MEKNNMDVFYKLRGKRFKEMFLQLGEWMIINFEDEIEYSLHAACFVRVHRGRDLLLTSSDLYFNPDKTDKDDEDKSGNLLEVNLETVNEVLRGTFVTDVKCTEVGDLILTFDNNCVIEIITDCIYEGYEYYRLCEYIPHYSDNDDITVHHYVLKYQKGELVFEED